MNLKQRLEDIITNETLPPLVRHKALTACIVDQQSFDALSSYFYHPNKHVVRYAADVLAKLTVKDASYAQSHKAELLSLLETTTNIGLKAHAATMVSCLALTEDELGLAWHLLTAYALDKYEAKSVRACSVLSLCNLLPQCPELKEDFAFTIDGLKDEEAPSLKAVVRYVARRKVL